MASDRSQTPLSFQILVALADSPRHGYGILKEIEERTGSPFSSSTGTLYLALQRLVQEDLVEEDPDEHEHADSRRRYYRLTDFGRQAAAAEARRLTTLLGVARDKRLVTAVELGELLQPAIDET